MKLPDITVAGHRYKVLFPHTFTDRDDLSGQIDPSQLNIKIAGRDLCGAEKKDSAILISFFHEVVHAIDRYYCMDKVGKEVGKEDLIESIAVGLTQICIDNDLLNYKKFGDIKL